MSQKKFAPTHPFIVFWLGVLTGVVLLAMMAHYTSSVLTPEEYQSSLYRNFYTPTYYVPTYSVTDPNMYSIGSPSGNITDPNMYSIGSPSGN